MYTQCPHCQTCFRIAEAHLKAARGRVRCGSCQEVFDASGHLFTKLPAIPENRIAPAAKVKRKPATVIPPQDHQHIDLSANPIKGTQPIPTSTPDQTEFMESTIGKNSRYNNLDNIGPIDVPGDIDMGDSFILDPNSGNQSRDDSNPYEDIESQELPANQQEMDQIKDLYSTADKLLQTDPSASDNQENLDKHIDELLAFTRGLEKNHEQDGSPEKADEEFDFDNLDDLADLADLESFGSETQPPAENKPFTAEDDTNKASMHKDRSIEFDAVNLAIEPNTGTQPVFADSSLGVKDPEPHLAFKQDQKSPPGDAKQKPAKPQSHTKVESKKNEELDLPDVQTDTSHAEIEEELPSFTHEVPRALRNSLEKAELPPKPLWQTIGLGFLSLLLVIGLAMQLILFRSADLVGLSPSLKPYLSSLCEKLPCTYNGRQDVSKITLTNRDVRSHPSQKNALLISATFVNQADYSQPYPDIQVTLSDLAGNIVAQRRFVPREYLDRMYNRFLLMEPGTPVQITLPVLDPGDDAVNFVFTFH